MTGLNSRSPLPRSLWPWPLPFWLLFHLGCRIADEASYRRWWDRKVGREETGCG
jgi:hypothetical protein